MPKRMPPPDKQTRDALICLREAAQAVIDDIHERGSRGFIKVDGRGVDFLAVIEAVRDALADVK